MSPARPRLITGPDAVRAVTALPRKKRPQEPVIYPWDMPGPGTVPVHEFGTIAAPANATQTVIVSYQVPDGYLFALTARQNLFVGGGLIAGAGSATWTTDVDTPVGIASPQGHPLQGLQAETVPVGSFERPWPMHYGYWVFPSRSIIRVKVTTTADITPGVPNYFISRLIGHCWLDK